MHPADRVQRATQNPLDPERPSAYSERVFNAAYLLERGVMTRIPYRAILALILLACVIPTGSVRAEDTKGKWQIGFGLSYYSTVDYIRSNSDIAIAAQTAEEAGSLPGIAAIDERPDENMLNQPSINDNFKLDFSASYGLTRWLAMEIQAGYMKSNVGNIEYYFSKAEVAYGSDSTVATQDRLCGPNGDQSCYSYILNTPGATPNNTFLPVGQLTEMPIMLSGIVRFRPESPLDPYLGAGVGYVLTSLETSGEFNSRAEEISSLHVTVASEGEWTDSIRRDKTAPSPGFSPAPLQATVNSGFEYHIVGGVDYYLNDHMSVYVDARYIWSNTDVNITIDGAHQVRLGDFRPGKLQTLSNGSATTPFLWEDRGFANCPTCAGDQLYATEDSNGNGELDTGGCSNPSSGFPCEGNTLYFFPTGPDPTDPGGVWHDPSEAVKVEDCAGCKLNNNLINITCGTANSACDSEDLNGNGMMDRFRLYGVDVCSLPNSTTNPVCGPLDFKPTTQYVWPGGCATTTSSTRLPEGCPAVPVRTIATSTSSQDDLTNVYLVQGGQIHLGAFSLGVGFKFTF
jgi:opacity protein-like surface antigen